MTSSADLTKWKVDRPRLAGRRAPYRAIGVIPAESSSVSSAGARSRAPNRPAIAWSRSRVAC